MIHRNKILSNLLTSIIIVIVVIVFLWFVLRLFNVTFDTKGGEAIVLAFFGILATFVVVGNYSQVSDVRSQMDIRLQKQDANIESQKRTIAEQNKQVKTDIEGVNKEFRTKWDGLKDTIKKEQEKETKLEEKVGGLQSKLDENSSCITGMKDDFGKLLGRTDSVDSNIEALQAASKKTDEELKKIKKLGEDIEAKYQKLRQADIVNFFNILSYYLTGSDSIIKLLEKISKKDWKDIYKLHIIGEAKSSSIDVHATLRGDSQVEFYKFDPLSGDLSLGDSITNFDSIDECNVNNEMLSRLLSMYKDLKIYNEKSHSGVDELNDAGSSSDHYDPKK